jgi:GNAT superfamily N-acetyltransferase
MDVLALSPDDWQLLRDVRLRALHDAPYAFTSSYERELGFDESAWRHSARTGQWFATSDGDDLVGIAGGVRGSTDGPATRELIGMWVAPSYRGRGVALALVERVCAWARADGASTLCLGVVEGNGRAMRAYQKMGFHPTGETWPVWNDPARLIEVMEMDLGSDSD